MLTVAEYHSPVGKQVREHLLIELLDAFQAIREDSSIPLDSEGDAMRLYLEAKLTEFYHLPTVAA